MPVSCFTTVSGINIRIAADRVYRCNSPGNLLCTTRDCGRPERCCAPVFWWLIREVTSLSLHLWPLRARQTPAWSEMKVLWLEGHKLLSRIGKEIPGEQIGIVLIKGERQGKGGKETLEQSNNVFPSWRQTVWGRIKKAEIVLLKECKNVDVEWLTNKGHSPLI